MSDPTVPAAPKPSAPITTPSPNSGETPPPAAETDWQTKFEAQQKVNRDLEAKFNTLRDSQSAQTEALAKALGLNEEAPDVSVLAATVRTLQDDFTKTQRQNLVLSVANDYGIQDPDAVADLASVQDVEAMRRLASRIATGGGSDNSSTAPGPRPDLSQGGHGTPSAGDPASQFASFLGRHLAG